MLALDREQRPDLYDKHGRYFTSEDYEGPQPADPLDDDVQAPDSEEPLSPVELSAEMTRLGIAVASQPYVLAFVAKADQVPNGRQAAKELGNPAYKTQPATAALEAARQDRRRLRT